MVADAGNHYCICRRLRWLGVPISPWHILDNATLGRRLLGYALVVIAYFGRGEFLYKSDTDKGVSSGFSGPPSSQNSPGTGNALVDGNPHCDRHYDDPAESLALTEVAATLNLVRAMVARKTVTDHSGYANIGTLQLSKLKPIRKPLESCTSNM